MNTIRFLSIIILLLGLVGIAIGGAFVGRGISTNNQIAEALRVENVTLGIDTTEFQGQVIDSMAEAEKAVSILQEHRRGIAKTYGELLGSGRFDPANPTHLTYAQALNLENYLYTAVIAFGVAQSIIANGAFMIATGLALIVVAFVIFKLIRKTG